MWPHFRSRSSPFREWWVAFHPCMGQMLDKTRDQMNNRRWDNPQAFRDQVDCSDPQTTSSGMVKWIGECTTWYGSDDLRAKIEPPSYQQYKPGDMLAVRPLNWEEIIDEDDDDETWVYPGAPSVSAKCKSVRKSHANLPDTPVNPIIASKYSQMLPGPPGAKQNALTLFKSILRSSDMWLMNIKILEQLWPLCSSAGNMVPYSHSSAS